MRPIVRGVARSLRLERPLLAVSRRLMPAHQRADIRERAQLVALLEDLVEPASDCLDVGAHEGAVLREMVRLAPQGRHIAWEPLPEFARRLRDRFPTVDVREAALSDRAGERAFAFVRDEPGWSGFRPRPTPRQSPVEIITVRCERLDDAIPPDVRPVLIKIDVEGAEEQVLLGAIQTLRLHRPTVALEHGAGSAEYYGTTPGGIHELLTGSLGYDIFGLDGEGPYTADHFAEIFASGRRVNFVARPTG
jgi:FkbM family methyltransferase